MLEKNLEECLNNAFKFAHENNHEFVTTEHLLLCILNNQEAFWKLNLKSLSRKIVQKKRMMLSKFNLRYLFKELFKELFFTCNLLEQVK